MNDSLQIAIRKASPEDVGTLYDLSAAMGHAKEPDYFERCFAMQEDGALDVYIAAVHDKVAAYGLLSWRPKYSYYKTHNIPEIQDLNVRPAMRRKGIAKAMIEYCENAARKKAYSQMGISVGLTANYGAAQRLYTKLGYIPDGNGVTYDRAAIQAGEFRMIDNNLCLMMVKHIA